MFSINNATYLRHHLWLLDEGRGLLDLNDGYKTEKQITSFPWLFKILELTLLFCIGINLRYQYLFAFNVKDMNENK